MDNIKVTMEAVQAGRYLAEELEELYHELVESIVLVKQTFEENKNGLGRHADSIYQLVNRLEQDTKTNREVRKLAKKLQLTSAVRQTHIEGTFPMSAVGEATTIALSDEQRIRRRTVFEITTLKNSLELSEGDSSVVQRGGAYRDVKKCVDSTLYEVHHIPPQSVFADSFKALPAIAMLKQDHAKTSSYKGKMNKTYQPYFPDDVVYPKHKLGVKDLIGQGLLAEAMRNEIYELRAMFGSKYDGAIKEYLNSMIEYISGNGGPNVKK